VTFVTWLFNPWDYGDAALLFAAVVVAVSLAVSPYRTRLPGGFAGVSVAAVVTTIYMVGAVATAGPGPLLPLGAMLLFLPAVVIACVIMWATADFAHRSRSEDRPQSTDQP